MFVNSWSIALVVCTVATLFLGTGAVKTSIKVLRFWIPDADTQQQIRLENETWLAATFVEYGLGLQILSLLLLVLAADDFSHILAGAMCATGSFLANDYGVPSLIIKLVGLFFYGFWIVLHRLDIQSEYYPLVRLKFYYLLFLVPLVLLDAALLYLYLSNLDPDIITSCCGVIFRKGSGATMELIGPLSTSFLMGLFYGLAGLLWIWGFILFKKNKSAGRREYPTFNIIFSLMWLLFFILSLLVITSVISPYIYAMPTHRCPFDILHGEYNYIGYPIYILLLAVTFTGMCGGLVTLLSVHPGLERLVPKFQKNTLSFCLVFLPCYLLLISWPPLRYVLIGGEH